MTTRIYTAKTVIFGCGNTLFGNDGFGPAVADHLNREGVKAKNVTVVDIGTGIRDFLFDLLLADPKPKQIIIVDAVTQKGRREGEIFEMKLAKIPREKASVFSLHQSPSSNLLNQLAETGIRIRVLAMHTDNIPEMVCPGLTPAAQAAVPKAAERIRNWIKNREVH